MAVAQSCSRCGKTWTGSCEHDVEVKIAGDPCPCEKEFAKLTNKQLYELATKNKPKPK